MESYLSLLLFSSQNLNTSVEFSPNQPALTLTPVCTLIKSIWVRFAEVPSILTASEILKKLPIAAAQGLFLSGISSPILSAYPQPNGLLDHIPVVGLCSVRAFRHVPYSV